MTIKNLVIFLIIIFISCYMVCINQAQTKTIKEKYTIPYSAEGNYSGLYKDLSECSLDDQKIIEIVNYAKLIAKLAGYEIAGDGLSWYVYKKINYPLKLKIYENSQYYLILFLPQSLPRTSLDLKVSIEKGSNKIISILQGS